MLCSSFPIRDKESYFEINDSRGQTFGNGSAEKFRNKQILRYESKVTFEEENLSLLFQPDRFQQLCVLTIKKQVIGSDWNTINNGLVLISSPSFQKLVILTGNLT